MQAKSAPTARPRRQFEIEIRGETVLSLPERLKLLAHFAWLIQTKPEKRFTSQRDDVAALPVVDQQLAHQWMEPTLYGHRPGAVTERLVGHRVDPEKPFTHAAAGLEIRHVCAVEMPVKPAPHQLPTATDEGLTVAHFLTPRITPKERKGASAGPRPMIGSSESLSKAWYTASSMPSICFASSAKALYCEGDNGRFIG